MAFIERVSYLGLLLFFFLEGLSPVVAQFGPLKDVSQYIHAAWKTQDGLPQISIQCIDQTHDGYLWLGTQEGLVRFDGVRFTVFDKSNTPQIRHNDVSSLLVSRDGGLWIGINGELILYKNGIFTAYITDPVRSNDIVICIHEDRHNNIWIGTFGGGLKKFSDGKFTSYSTKDGLSNVFVNAIAEDKDGVLWIATNAGLNRFKDGRFTVFSKADGLPNDIIWSLKESRTGGFWIGTSGGLTLFKDGKFKNFSTKDGLSDIIIRSLFEDRQGNLWIGTERGGLNRLVQGHFSSFSTKDGLSSDQVIALFQDRESNIWIGTYTGGLNRLWEGKFTTFTTREGLSSDQIRTICEAKDGSIWIGSEGGGVTRLKDGKFTNFTTKDGLPDILVRALFVDREDNIWVGTNGGVSCFRGGKFINYGTKDGLAHVFVRAITQDPSGHIWVGTRGGGVHCMENGRFVNWRDKGIPFNVIRSLFVDHAGNIWVGSNDGLTLLKNGQITHFNTQNGLSPDPVYVIYEDAESTLWIGTYGGGLNRFKDGKITRITSRDGLFDDIAYQILEDGDQNLWMSCNRGIYRASKKVLNDFADGRVQKVSCVSFGSADGMRSSECNGNCQPAGCRTLDGSLWFPTNAGIVVIDPRNIPQNTLAPLVTLEEVIVDKQSYFPHKPIVAPPGRGSLEFYFTGLSFIAPEKLRFKYQLEGFDPGWIDAGTRREAFYTNIPPRQYKFKVIACNNDGLWNEVGDSLEVKLEPYFYQTVWFYAICVLSFIGIALTLYRLRVWRLLERERELTHRVDDALAKIKILGGLIPICANCKKIRDDHGYWNQVEKYLKEHSRATFSHGICPECMEKLYGDFLK